MFGSFFKMAAKAAKAAAAVVCGAIVSEIGLFLLRRVGNNGKLVHVWDSLTSSIDIVFTAKQVSASAGGFAAQVNVIAATGLAVANFSVIVGGMALGIKAYWKNHEFKEDTPIVDLIVVDDCRNVIEGRLNNSRVQEAALKFEERPAPVLHQANAHRRDQHHELHQRFQDQAPHREPESQSQSREPSQSSSDEEYIMVTNNLLKR